ncbi:MAG: DASH family cryptochrome [Saprospiraceae bacterium]
MKNRSLLWFRQDLRLHDNEALYEALRWNNEVIPVYVFDPRVFVSVSQFGHRRMSRLRAQFTIDSVVGLRQALRNIGSDLLVRVGKPEEEIYNLAKEFRTDVVFCNRERTPDEMHVQDSLEQNLWTIGQEMRFTRGKMLYYTQDLPFPVTHTPDNFSIFRKELERIIPVRQILPFPDSVSPILQSFEPREIPSIKDLGFEEIESTYKIYKGGQEEGLKKLKEFIWSPEGLPKYRVKDRFIIQPMFSSELSPWLAHGCISPKMVYHEIKSYESIYGVDENTQSMTSDLMRRDFCRLMAKKYGFKIFEPEGVSNKIKESIPDEQYLFRIWKEGRTGIPIVDASMKSLASTGYLPYPLRFSCAHFLIYQLRVHWRLGADWYEANLIDYDVASNWVNWMILAGLLPEAQEEKTMSLDYLSKKFDPNGDFVKKWLPALQNLPPSKIFHPENLEIDEQKKYGLIVGKDFPKPVINW